MKKNKYIIVDKMTDTYLQNQNISNNIILNRPKDNYKGKKLIKNKDNNESHSSSNEDKNETIDNKINDSSTSLDIEEVPLPEQDIDHLQKFNNQNKNIYNLNYENRSNSSRNKNNVKIVSKKINSLTAQHHLNRVISENRIPLPQKTNYILGNNNQIFDQMGYKRAISGERTTVKQTQSRFSSSSENKDNIFHRKTMSNSHPEIQNNFNNNNSPSSQNRNLPILTAKVIKLSSEFPIEKNMIKKKLSSKINENYKKNNFYSVNNYYGNSYKDLNLSPSGPKNKVKIVNKNNLDTRQINTVNNLDNSNNININRENFTNNNNLINNNNKNQDNFGNESSKKKVKNINIIKGKVSNFEIFDGNNTIGYYSKNKMDNNKIRINTEYLKEINDNNQQNHTKSPQNSIKMHSSSNKNINENQRLTVPSKLSNRNEKEYQNPKIMKIEQFQQISPKKINQPINFEQNVKYHSQTNSPKGATVKKLIPLNKNSNNIFPNLNQSNKQILNKINRQSGIPKPNYIGKEEINVRNEPLDKRNNNIKSTKNIFYVKNNNLTNNTNNIRNINSIINSTNILNMINNDDSMNNIQKNKINNIQQLKNSNSMNNIKKMNNINNLNNKNNNTLNNSNNKNIINNIKINNMNIINNEFNIQNINNNKSNLVNNVGNINNISRNPNLKNLNNKKTNYKISPPILNELNNNPLLNNMEQIINPAINKNKSTITNNIILQEMNQSYGKPILNILQQSPQQNNFASPTISKISIESQRLTQIPSNMNELQNFIYPQNKIYNHPPINYQSSQNEILLYSSKENQIFNNIQNNDINLKKQEIIINNEKIINELENQKGLDITYNEFDGSGWIKNYGILTLPGKDISGSHKTNQDSFVFKTKINKIRDFNIFGVLDGHGPEGHYVSKFTSEFIPSLLSNHPQIKSLTEPEQIYKKLKENNCKIITQTFIEADKQLKKASFDALESGCTCVLIIHIGSHIICANTGDSRAIVVHDEKGENNINYFRSIPLSIDYKPELPEETNRILMSGGIVRQMKDELGEGVGPYRVWARDGDYPGLAMSRSIGDLKGKNLGIIPDPGILEYDLCEKTKYIVVCSDGVWEFLSNENVKDIGKQFYMDNNPSGYCHELINQSLNFWEENDIVVDDITAVVAFF